jgi:hypothetical protein
MGITGIFSLAHSLACGWYNMLNISRHGALWGLKKIRCCSLLINLSNNKPSSHQLTNNMYTILLKSLMVLLKVKWILNHYSLLLRCKMEVEELNTASQFTSSMPGSLMPGVPASLITATASPSWSLFKILGSLSRSLNLWKLSYKLKI